jgi:hypothetical protein
VWCFWTLASQEQTPTTVSSCRQADMLAGSAARLSGSGLLMQAYCAVAARFYYVAHMNVSPLQVIVIQTLSTGRALYLLTFLLHMQLGLRLRLCMQVTPHPAVMPGDRRLPAGHAPDAAGDV